MYTQYVLQAPVGSVVVLRQYVTTFPATLCGRQSSGECECAKSLRYLVITQKSVQYMIYYTIVAWSGDQVTTFKACDWL